MSLRERERERERRRRRRRRIEDKRRESAEYHKYVVFGLIKG